MKAAGLAELNSFVTVARCRSFRRAADELGVSPSSLSHAIAAMEKRLGVRLFNRTTRSVSLTDAGDVFLARVSPALKQIDSAMESINDFRDTPSGTLRLNASEGAAEMLMSPLIIEYVRRYPQMHVQVATDSRFVDIVAAGFDAGIRLAESVPRDMVAVPCTRPLRFAVVGSPEYFASRRVPMVPDDLVEHRCIRTRFQNGALYKWEFARNGESLSIDVDGPLTLDYHHLMVDAALKGVGLAWTSEFAVAEHIRAGRLVRVLEDWSPEFPGLCLYYPANRLPPMGLRVLIDLARDLMAAPTTVAAADAALPAAISVRA